MATSPLRSQLTSQYELCRNCLLDLFAYNRIARPRSSGQIMNLLHLNGMFVGDHVFSSHFLQDYSGSATYYFPFLEAVPSELNFSDIVQIGCCLLLPLPCSSPQLVTASNGQITACRLSRQPMMLKVLIFLERGFGITLAYRTSIRAQAIAPRVLQTIHYSLVV